MAHPTPGRMSETGEVKSAASKLFDLRVLIGGLFVFYGIVLTITGIVDGAAARRKASGIDINLWMGLAMLLLGLLFLLWWRLRPLLHEATEPDEAGSRSGH